MEMESMQVESPFKSPRFKSLPLRTRIESGSSVSSTERDSPHRRQHAPGSCNVSITSNTNGVSDENEDPQDATGATGDRVNPFERDILSGLEKSFWSPSIMEIKETPPQRTWAIEHLSHLFPKDIENSPSTHQNDFPIDAQTEAKAQADIDAYFNRGPIVPTPSPMKETRHLHNEVVRLKTNNIPYGHCGQSPVARGGVLSINSGNILKKTVIKKLPVASADRWTQTMLSFPQTLPQHVQDVLSQYCQEDNLCGSSEEVPISLLQRTELLEQGECGDNNDSGKNSSYLNNSIRRRLELSFGEDPDGENSNGVPTLSPIRDPFMCNHVVSTPPDFSAPKLNTTTSELELQFMRCEFTPEARGIASAMSPGITPIQNDLDDIATNKDNCSTPRRVNANPKRTLKSFVFQMSMSTTTTSSGGETQPIPSSTESDNTQNLRRGYPESPQPRAIKTTSAYSFDDSQLLMGCSPKPAKLHRSNSANDAS